jgi:hypothetical protein
MSIPKIVYLSWKHKNILNSQSPLILNGMKKLVDLNPDWQFTVYDDKEIDDYIKDALPRSEYKLVENIHIVAKTDIWRLLKLHSEGGLYVDIDRLCNISLSDLVDDKTMWVLPTYKDSDFSHDFMMTAPNNPAFAKAIELYFDRRRMGHTNIYFLGPQTYMNAVSMVLCGKMLDTNPGQKLFEQIRSIIDEATFIKTYRENPPNDTIIYKSDEPIDLETIKRQFYAEEGLKHWTGEW